MIDGGEPARDRAAGPGWVAVRPFSKSIEQAIAIAFATMPNEEDVQGIDRALCRMLEQIARA